MVTEEQIKNVFLRLKDAADYLRNKTEKEIQFKMVLENAKLDGLRRETITGKNAELREANAREVLSELYHRVEASEIEQRQARYTWDLVNLDLDELKMLLRLDELLAKGE
jgi:hypothetical protein